MIFWLFFSKDLEHSFRIAHKLDFGGIVINGTNNYRPPVVPFGGVGLAGTGREGLGYTMDELTRSRFIAVRNIRPHSEIMKKDNVWIWIKIEGCVYIKNAY